MALNKTLKKKKDWKCPFCGANSINLDPDEDHKQFDNQFREFIILIRCCNCQAVFKFSYAVNNVELNRIGEINEWGEGK